MPTVVNDYTALLSGSYWNGIEVTDTPVIVTFSFPTSLPAYDASVGGFTADTLASFQAFTPDEQTQAIAALNEWAAASGLVFVQVAPGQGDINFANVDFDTTSSPSYSGAGGIGFYPFGLWSNFSYPSFTSDLDSSGDVFMNTQFQNPDGTVNYGTLLHEIGHAIGLKHPTEVVTDLAAEPPVVHDQVLASDDPTRTIMATVGDTSITDPHLLQLDKDAAAALYGASGTGGVYTSSASGTNSVSNWVWDSTTQTLTQTAATTNDTIRGSSVHDDITGSSGDDRLFGLAGDDLLQGAGGNDSLYGGSGTNTLVGGAGDDVYFVDSATDTIVEDTGEGIDSVNATISFTLPDNIEVLALYGSGLTGTGNNQGDVLFGDYVSATRLNGGTGDDYLAGGSGDDTISGGGGTDVMWGEAGADRFIFTSVTDALAGGLLTTIGDFTPGQDKINLAGITTTGSNPGQPLHFIGTGPFVIGDAGQVREDMSGASPVVEGDVNGDGTADFAIELYGSPTLQGSDFQFTPACYRAGTRILTVQGEVKVERLVPGDQVLTEAGEAATVVWVGHRRLSCRTHPDPRLVWPVRISAGAFADRQPHRDLWLSPDHAVLQDGVLIPIRHLINGTTIVQVPMDRVSYHHVELARHDVLLAEGLAAESYLDTGNRHAFANAGSVLELHPSFGAPRTWRDDAAAPLADEAQARVAWQRLAARSNVLGQPIEQPRFTDDPAIALQADDRWIAPAMQDAESCRFVLPRGVCQVRLLSRSGEPTDARPWVDDRRRLGVYVSGIVWHTAAGPRVMPLDHPDLTQGWHAVERAGPALRRWTDGDAVLPCPPGAMVLELYLAGGLPYRLDAAKPPVTSAAPAARPRPRRRSAGSR